VIRRPVRLLLGLALSGTATSACTFTTVVPLHYAAPAGAARSAIDTPLISVGTFQDGRDASYGLDWLGAIRSGFGNAFKKLRTEKAMSEIVQEAFADGLRERGVYAEPGIGRFTLEGTIAKLDCSEYWNLEAHVHLDVRVTESASHQVLYTKSYRANQTEGGIGFPVLARVETLRALAERTLTDAVDQVLDDGKLREALQGR